MITNEYASYQAQTTQRIKDSIERCGVRPVLFVGSGMSIRYMGAPSWPNLLGEALDLCPGISDMPIGYWLQQHQNKPEACAEALVGLFWDWAWKNRHTPSFPFSKKMFEGSRDQHSYLKQICCDVLDRLMPPTNDLSKPPLLPYQDELRLLRKTHPHCIITTNYDRLLELLFPNYTRIVGEEFFGQSIETIGEIYKIHGCASDPNGIVLTTSDYEKYADDRKYIIAKLTTLFVEHPVIFLGYSLSDKNLQPILAGVDKLIIDRAGKAHNLFLVDYKAGIEGETSHSDADRIELTVKEGTTKTIGVNLIEAENFGWIFKALAHNAPVKAVNVRLLRDYVSRVRKLTRGKMMASEEGEVSYEWMRYVSSNDPEAVRRFVGLDLADMVDTSKTHPYLATHVAAMVGEGHWNKVFDHMEKVEEAHGVRFKSKTNVYVSRHQVGDRRPTFGYSTLFVDLIMKVKAGTPYTLEEEFIENCSVGAAPS